MLESSLQEESQRYCQGKFLSMAISRGMSFSPKRWCCATGAKLVTCLATIILLSHPLKKIPACLSLSGVLLLHGIQALDSLIILQRLFLALNLFATTFTSVPTNDVVRGDRSGEVSDSDSNSESGSGSCSDSDSHNESNSGSEHSSEKFPSQPLKETSSEIPKDQTYLGRILHRSQIQMYIQNVPAQQQRNVL